MPLPAALRSSSAWRCAISRACRSCRKLNAAIDDCAAVISSAFTICPMPGLSSSASSAPRGSDAIAAIEPARGPIPKRCKARAATPFASSDMVEILKKRRRSAESKAHTTATSDKIAQLARTEQAVMQSNLSIGAMLENRSVPLFCLDFFSRRRFISVPTQGSRTHAGMDVQSRAVAPQRSCRRGCAIMHGLASTCSGAASTRCRFRLSCSRTAILRRRASSW